MAETDAAVETIDRHGTIRLILLQIDDLERGDCMEHALNNDTSIYLGTRVGRCFGVNAGSVHGLARCTWIDVTCKVSQPPKCYTTDDHNARQP